MENEGTNDENELSVEAILQDLSDTDFEEEVLFTRNQESDAVPKDTVSGIAQEMPKFPTLQLKLVDNSEKVSRINENGASNTDETGEPNTQEDGARKDSEIMNAEENVEVQKKDDPQEVERRKRTLDLIRLKRQEMFAKTYLINSLHAQIADLNAPVAEDVSKLRNQVDRCFTQLRELRDESIRVNESIEKAVQVQQKLQDQLGSLEEKRKEAIFELENKHLMQLKGIEEEIRQLL